MVPYGTPDVPGRPNAALGSNTSGQANVSWGASADFNGTGPYYVVRASNGATSDVGNRTSTTFTGLNNGTEYTFQVQACNAYTCSDWSAASNGVTPYGVPPKPTITASGGDQKVNFSWNAEGTNGRPTTVRVSGAFTSTAKSGSQSVATGYSTLERACVTVTDSEGQTAEDCAEARSDARPDPRAWVTPGSSVNTSECTHSSCAYFVVNWQDFPSGTHSVECMSGTNPDESGWHNILTPDRSYSMNFGGNGSAQLRCFYGYPNTDVGVRINGTSYEVRTWR